MGLCASKSARNMCDPFNPTECFTHDFDVLIQFLIGPGCAVFFVSPNLFTNTPCTICLLSSAS